MARDGTVYFIFGLTTALDHDGYRYLGTGHSGSNDVMRYPRPAR